MRAASQDLVGRPPAPRFNKPCGIDIETAYSSRRNCALAAPRRKTAVRLSRLPI